MPRAWGKYELQQLVKLAFHAGVKMGTGRRVVSDDDVPDVDDLLREIGITHPLNVPCDPTKARTWHPKRD